MTLPVCERFLSWQGEGASVGCLAYFIRLQGCNLSCSWCFGEDTKILLRDFTWKDIQEIEVGESVMGVDHSQGEARLCTTTVLNSLHRKSPTVGVTVGGGANTGFVSTAEHPFYVQYCNKEGKRWRHAYVQLQNCFRGNKVLPFLPVQFAQRGESYRRGWLVGMAYGDGSFHLFKGKWLRFKLAQKPSHEYLVDTFIKWAREFGFDVNKVPHKVSEKNLAAYKVLPCAQLTVSKTAEAFQRFLDLNILSNDIEYSRGFLAGLHDSEGSIKTDGGDVRISQKERGLLEDATVALRRLSIDSYIRKDKMFTLIIPNKLRFLMLVTPFKVDDGDVKKLFLRNSQVVSNHDLKMRPNGREAVFNLTTSSKNFIANGFVVHNCDSKYALTGHGKKEEVSQIVGEINNYIELTDAHPLVVITGGEPLLHVAALHPFIEEIQKLGLEMEIETNGTLAPFEWEDVMYNVSPKLYSSGNPPEKVIDTDILEKFADLPSIFKFVVKTWKDWKEMEQIIDTVGIPKEFVYVMPEGRSAEAIKKHVWKFKDNILKSGYNLSPRMHIEYFGNKRKV